jgi:L-asparagine transporter-like permease
MKTVVTIVVMVVLGLAVLAFGLTREQKHRTSCHEKGGVLVKGADRAAWYCINKNVVIE